MNDLRFTSGHLEPPRRQLYVQARESVLDAVGETTREVGRRARVRQPSSGYELRLVRWPAGAPGLPPVYAPSLDVAVLVCPLRVGLTTLGRMEDNDIVLCFHAVSRRHCVIIVHATGGCEVRDTASRNGTLVNGTKVEHAVLHPGDHIRICDFEFVVAGGPGGSRAASPPDAMIVGGPAANTTDVTLG
jgi:hypothetical protein